MNTNKIEIPAEIIEELELDDKTPLQLSINNQKITIKTAQNEPENQTITLRWFLIPSVIASLIFLGYNLANGISQIKMTGQNSIASMVIILGLISGICSFAFFFIRGKKRKFTPQKDIYWRNFPTILISFSIMLGLLIVGFFWLIGIIFEGASFDYFTATLIFFMFLSVINYLMILFALSTSPNVITTLLISVIIGGVLISMAANSQLQWWQINFSFLGTNKAAYSWQFNLTLIISALLLVALLDYLFVPLQRTKEYHWQLTILKFLLNLAAISLAGVGIFPNNGRGSLHQLHNHVANLLVYIIIILIISIRWLLPKVSREFLTFSYFIGICLVLCEFLFSSIGYFSLTAFELIAFFMAFSWILLLIQNLKRLSSKTKKSYQLFLCE